MNFLSRLCKGFCMALSMFSIIPTPRIWDDDATGLMLPMLPLVGVITGSLWFGFSTLLVWACVPVMLQAVLVLLFPLFATGFLHIDGYMDTCDAIFSRAELDKRRAILKDSNVGAFAVIAVCVYLLTGFAAVYTALGRGADLTAFFFVPILPRCIAGLASLNIKPIWESGFVASFRENAKSVHTAALVIQGALCLTIGGLIGGTLVFAVICVAFAGAGIFCIYSVKHLSGMSGDLCGFTIAGGELCALLALSVL